jgi:hypothetical protein
MSLLIAIGESAYSAGHCCVSIGDNTKSIGAFQVDFCETITLPELSVETAVDIANRLRETIEVYRAMVKQGYARQDFLDKAEKAISYAIRYLRKY